jgi:hypothetical protein
MYTYQSLPTNEDEPFDGTFVIQDSDMDTATDNDTIKISFIDCDGNILEDYLNVLDRGFIKFCKKDDPSVIVIYSFVRSTDMGTVTTHFETDPDQTMELTFSNTAFDFVDGEKWCICFDTSRNPDPSQICRKLEIGEYGVNGMIGTSCQLIPSLTDSLLTATSCDIDNDTTLIKICGQFKNIDVNIVDEDGNQLTIAPGSCCYAGIDIDLTNFMNSIYNNNSGFYGPLNIDNIPGVANMFLDFDSTSTTGIPGQTGPNWIEMEIQKNCLTFDTLVHSLSPGSRVFRISTIIHNRSMFNFPQPDTYIKKFSIKFEVCFCLRKLRSQFLPGGVTPP